VAPKRIALATGEVSSYHLALFFPEPRGIERSPRDGSIDTRGALAQWQNN
jgi:hypothetical protein